MIQQDKNINDTQTWGIVMVEAFFGVHENKNKKGIMLYTYILAQKKTP